MSVKCVPTVIMCSEPGHLLNERPARSPLRPHLANDHVTSETLERIHSRMAMRDTSMSEAA